MDYTIKTIYGYINEIKSVLSEKRFNHSLGVAEVSRELAEIYGVPVDKAIVAGVLHDVAKEIKGPELIRLCNEAGVELKPVEIENTALIHSKYGAYLAKTKYGIDDEDILNAISNHTVGRPGMSRLEEIVFAADYIEPGRGDTLKRINEIREVIKTDITRAIFMIYENQFEYFKTEGKTVDPISFEAMEYYKKLLLK